MKFHRYIFILLVLINVFSCKKEQIKDVYLFSFFKDNGQDGLHLAASYDGYKWFALNKNKSFLVPEVGKDKLMRDPCIIKGGDGKFQMVWTTGWNDRGIGYANSTDLIHWSKQKYLPVMEDEPKTRNCWAPELFYNEKNGEYMIYWASTIPKKFPETDTLGDNGYNHRIYYTLTKDFVHFSKTKLLYDKGFNVIDATIAKTDSLYVMFLKNETLKPKPEKNIRIATSKQLTEAYTDASAPISPNWVEGPTVIRIGKQWIVYFDKYTKGKMGAVASTDLKNWKDISDKIVFPEGTRHGTVFKANAELLQEFPDFDKSTLNSASKKTTVFLPVAYKKCQGRGGRSVDN